MRIQISSQKSILLRLLQMPIDKQPTGNKFEIQFDSVVEGGILEISCVGGMILNATTEQMGTFFRKLWEIQASGDSTCTLIETPENTENYTEKLYHSFWPASSPTLEPSDMLYLASNWSNPWITVSLFRSVERSSHPIKEGVTRIHSLPSGYFLFPIEGGRCTCIWSLKVRFNTEKMNLSEIEEVHRAKSVQLIMFIRSAAEKQRRESENLLTPLDLNLPFKLPHAPSFLNPTAQPKPLDLLRNLYGGGNFKGMKVENHEANQGRLTKRSRTTKPGEENRRRKFVRSIECDNLSKIEWNHSDESPSNCVLIELPQEIISIIVTFMDYKSVVALSSTCHHFRPLSFNKKMWRELYLESHPNDEFLKKLSSDLKNVSIDFKTVWKRKELEKKNWRKGESLQIDLNGHNQSIKTLEFVGSDGIVTGSRDSTLRFWNFRSGLCDKKFCIENSGAVLASSVLGGGSRVIAAFERGALCMWDLSSGQAFWMRRFTNMSHGFQFNGSKFFSWSTSVFDYWNLETGLKERSFQGHLGKICCVKTISNRVASGSEDGVVKYWDKETGDCINSYSTNGRKVKDLSLSQQMLLIGAGDEAELYDLRTQQCVKSTGKQGFTVEKTSMDENRIFFCGKKMVKYSDWNGDILKMNELKTEEYVTSICSDLSKIAAGGRNGLVRIWDFSSNK
eukprot:TRINITY_DN7357_c0_g1_i1.p1 TRINITY_DN7357_c0_g1~~TRINITY_DN7357_c0_g1_i1.p1  ORF type:complete len:677 (-),score=233.60 TRINITY_DN7357_c0_g1_i1:53-2083(-)